MLAAVVCFPQRKDFFGAFLGIEKHQTAHFVRRVRDDRPFRIVIKPDWTAVLMPRCHDSFPSLVTVCRQPKQVMSLPPDAFRPADEQKGGL
jgi:hypothetical protein